MSKDFGGGAAEICIGLFLFIKGMVKMNDTIAAISTPFGEGGIGIIRISGESAFSIIKEVFRRPGKSQEMENRKLTYGNIIDPETGKMIDEVLCVEMKAPGTYTAEDVAEIHCHGGTVLLRKTLELVLQRGARLADKGEFTQRAFLNGRLDLTQAEAVMDMIRAKADRSLDAAVHQLEGVLSDKIREIRAMLMDLLVELTVNIDYPDEDIEVLTYEKTEKSIALIRKEIEMLLQRSETGRIISEGLKVSIVGKPNVGKSSLMNHLLREARAIVTDIPGTTRDTIQESLNIRGIPLVLTDTAGIRETDDQIESIGIERSKESLMRADLVIFMMDSSTRPDKEDREIIARIDPARTIAVLNKTDLDPVVTDEEVRDLLPGVEVIRTSLTQNSGVSRIEDSIVRRVYSGEVSQEDSLMVTNVRHKNLLENARAAVMSAGEMTESGEPLEIIEEDVHEAYDILGEIIGESVTDDILNEVFSRFCLGK